MSYVHKPFLVHRPQGIAGQVTLPQAALLALVVLGIVLIQVAFAHRHAVITAERRAAVTAERHAAVTAERGAAAAAHLVVTADTLAVATDTRRAHRAQPRPAETTGHPAGVAGPPATPGGTHSTEGDDASRRQRGQATVPVRDAEGDGVAVGPGLGPALVPALGPAVIRPWSILGQVRAHLALMLGVAAGALAAALYGAALIGRRLRHPGRAPEDSRRAVLRAVPFAGPEGDVVALLVARTRAPAADRIADRIADWDVPRDPAAVARIRKAAAGRLDAWGLAELGFTTELVLGELVANAIRHGAGPIHVRLIHGRTLICEVADGSSACPHAGHAADSDEGGRGLFLVAQMTDGWGVRHTPWGKVVWAEQALPGPAHGSA